MVGTAAGRELENEHYALVAPGSIETVRGRYRSRSAMSGSERCKPLVPRSGSSRRGMS
jgi:hypothetical protein